MNRTKFLSVGIRDLISGAFLAAIASIGTYALSVVNIMQETGTFEFSWEGLQKAGIIALGVFCSYIIKNLLSNKEGTPLKKD